MIEEIQISNPKYRRARCQKCKKKILPLEMRGVVRGSLYFGYLCKKCNKEELLKLPLHIKKMNEKYKEFEKMNDEEKLDYLNRLEILKKL